MIDNASDHALTLIVFPDSLMPPPFLNYEFDTMVIPSQTEFEIAFDEGIGTTNGYKGCEVPIDSFHFFVDGIDSLKVKTDIKNSTFWRFRVLDKDAAGGGECECRLIITNDNIQ